MVLRQVNLACVKAEQFRCESLRIFGSPSLHLQQLATTAHEVASSANAWFSLTFDRKHLTPFLPWQLPLAGANPRCRDCGSAHHRSELSMVTTS